MSGSVHNLKAEAMQPGDVRIDRATALGNPFRIGRDGTRDEVIELFERYARTMIRDNPGFRRSVAALRGKRLFCWCAPLPCHGGVLLKLAEELHT